MKDSFLTERCQSSVMYVTPNGQTDEEVTPTVMAHGFPLEKGAGDAVGRGGGGGGVEGGGGGGDERHSSM